MTLGRILGIRIRVHPTILVLVGLCMLLSSGGGLLLALALVLAHELCHCLVARLLGVQVVQIELAPFGGVATMQGVDNAPLKEAAIAAAGPAANLLLALGGGFVAYGWPGTAPQMSGFIASNLALLLFNLLPALPLDGGRLLRALLTHFVGHRAASKLGGGMGVLCGVATALLVVPVWLETGKWNLTLLICGVYIALAATREFKNIPFQTARGVMQLRIKLERGKAVPVHLLAAPLGTPPLALARAFRPGRLYQVVLLDEDLTERRRLWQWEVQRELLRGEETQT